MGISLLSIYLALRLLMSPSSPLVLSAVLDFCFFGGAILTGWFLCGVINRSSEFAKAVMASMLLIPVSLLLVLPDIMISTPLHLRVGVLGPNHLSLIFLGKAFLATFGIIFLGASPLWLGYTTESGLRQVGKREWRRDDAFI